MPVQNKNRNTLSALTAEITSLSEKEKYVLKENFSDLIKPATTSTLGGIIVGDNLTIDEDGKLNAVAGTYTLPAATTTELGGVKIGYTTSESNRKFAVQLDASNKMFVNVPYATYSVATTSSNGLMSASDKTKLDGLSNVSYEVDDTNLEITLTL